MLRRLLGALVWLDFASAGSRRRRGEGKVQFRGPIAGSVGILGKRWKQNRGKGKAYKAGEWEL